MRKVWFENAKPEQLMPCLCDGRKPCERCHQFTKDMYNPRMKDMVFIHVCGACVIELGWQW